MLWLALHLPQLPLEVHTRASARATAAIVTTQDGNRACVLSCNDMAARAGIYPGLAVSAAHALVAGLHVYRRDLRAEQSALEKLATLATTYTPAVSIAPPLTVWLEIEGSLKLFGGAERLLRRLGSAVRRLGYTSALAAAPAPLGAQFLARAGKALVIRDPAQLRSALAPLPIAVLELPDAAHQAMREIGVRTLRDLLRLPRAGLARRFGVALVEQLDRALGRSADPPLRYEPPQQFESLLHFPEPVNDAEALLFSARRQLRELSAFLEARCAGVRAVEWRLRHWRAAPSVIRIESAQVHRNARRYLDLLRERLGRQPLPAAVESLELYATKLEAHEPATAQLFPGAAKEHMRERGMLLERLRARLGAKAVYGFALVADHRPEYAFRRQLLDSPSPFQGEGKGGGRRLRSPARFRPLDKVQDRFPPARGRELPSRPLWLLQTPAPLASNGTHPQCHGELTVESGPERIESGWWDQRPVARDYFIARNPEGVRLWVFREREGFMDGSRRWFLHGLFS